MSQNLFGKSVDAEVCIILEFWCCYLHFSCDTSKQNNLNFKLIITFYKGFLQPFIVLQL